MKAWHIVEGTSERLRSVNIPEPKAGPGEVLIRVRAVSLNYRDLVLADGKSRVKNLNGRIPASDGAGEVVAVGAGVENFAVGDSVAGCFFQTWTRGRFEMRHHDKALGGTVDGMLAEYVHLNAAGVVKTPSNLTHLESACLPCAGLTAWYALVDRGGLMAGDSVLTLGTGGVSLFALQFAVAHGASVYATSSSDDKLARAKAFGAVGTVNYKATPEWDKEVWRLTGERGVDHVVEVGGAGTLGKSLNCLSAGGNLAVIGILTGTGASDSGLFPLMGRNATAHGIYVGPADSFSAMNRFIERKAIRPVIDKVFAFSEAPAAYEHLASGSHFGKVVIDLS